MDVPVDLREPDRVELLGDDAGLGLGEHEPVAVVVVAGVILIELQKLGRLVGRADGLAVPLGDVVETVGVEAGEDRDHEVAAGGCPGLFVGRREPVGELHGELRRRGLRCVHCAGDKENHLAVADGGLLLLGGRSTRVRDDPGVGLKLIESCEVLGAGDHRQEELATLRGGSDRPGDDAVRLAVEFLEVAAHLLPVGELEIDAGRASEVLGGGGDLAPRAGGAGQHNEPHRPRPWHSFSFLWTRPTKRWYPPGGRRAQPAVRHQGFGVRGSGRRRRFTAEGRREPRRKEEGSGFGSGSWPLSRTPNPEPPWVSPT